MPDRGGVEVRLENLVRRYGNVTALDGLSLTIAPGELVALLGPSGCGKTTALRLLAGLEPADEGRVVVAGDDVTNLPASKRNIGMVFQAYSLFPHMVAWENVAFGLQMRHVSTYERKKRALAMLELVGLGRMANRYANQMSGGQQQRVALARALAIQPQVLLLDEPLSALDAKVRARLRDEIRRVQLEVGITTQVLSGHGRVANDMYSPFDEAYPNDFPQRHQDFAQAKSLLKAAGKENLVVDLHTTDGAAGMVDVANVFAQQAKGAGVTINVRNDPNYYGDAYLKLAFSVDFWGTRNYLPQVANGSIPTAPYNETHWPPKDSNYLTLYKQALAEPDAAKRKDLKRQMYKLEYDQGGYIIPFFNNLVDAYSKKVSGFVASKGTLNLDSFGHGFRSIWFG